MSSSTVNNDSPPIVIHLFVVGFHHKKGCVVEYCYPPILKQHSSSGGENADQNSGDSTVCSTNDLPFVWKTLPQLSLPDGAHNHERDTIYFHLPDIDDHNQTIFGVSCYRQINVEKLIARTSDMTRGTVQKSVVVLSRLPLYGLITAKLEIITHAYFHELDFSKVSVLEETYHSLNNQLNYSMMKSSQELLFGLSPRQLVTTFHHKILILFKLILLERKVLFYKSPVRELCATILTLCSLVPGMLEKGLSHSSLSVHPKNGRQHSTDVELSASSSVDDGIAEDDEHLVLTSNTDCGNTVKKSDNHINNSEKTLDLCEHTSNSQNKMIVEDSDDECNRWHKNHDSDDDLLREIDEVLSINSNGSNVPSAKSSPEKESSSAQPAVPVNQSSLYDQLLMEPKPERMDKISDTDRETPPLLKLPLDECGFPLELFTCGSYCHPYLSLTYLDVLTDVRVRSCLVGATNFLFKQKRDIFDVIVEIDTGKIDATDSDLRKQLSLTTEDLRFVDYLVKTVISEKDRSGDKDTNSDLFNDGNVDWEGSDDWIRYQFKLYLLHLLRSSELDETTRDYISFNSNFMTAWRSTHNYKIWSSVSHPGVFEVNAGHPFSGHLSVNDMKLRLSHMLYSKSDQNKKINQTVMRTSKAVGGALTSAKSAVSSWWSNWSSASSTTTAAVVSGQEKTDELKKSQVAEQETQL